MSLDHRYRNIHLPAISPPPRLLIEFSLRPYIPMSMVHTQIPSVYKQNFATIQLTVQFKTSCHSQFPAISAIALTFHV